MKKLLAAMLLVAVVAVTGCSESKKPAKPADKAAMPADKGAAPAGEAPKAP